MSSHPELDYLCGFGNQLASEALPNALPKGRNSPQEVAYGLYAEQLSVTAFTVPRANNRRSWLYRILPTVCHGSPTLASIPNFDSAPLPENTATLRQIRWNPPGKPEKTTDFVDGIITLGAGGDATMQTGIAVHVYAANESMLARSLANTDGELLVVPQQGTLDVTTELGRLIVSPGEMLLIPRGVRFRIALLSEYVTGYICENYGDAFKLPDLGTIGANGLANPRDFLAPVAAFEDREESHQILTKSQGQFWESKFDHSPFDVVAWHGNVYPVKYDLRQFNALGSITYDHPDPSIFTVLTSVSNTPGVANCDFAAFPPRWLVAENTFRPPYFHRNIMSEYMGLIFGTHEAKANGFVPGGGSLHNAMAPHGPDKETTTKATQATLQPDKFDQSLAFMFESRYPLRIKEPRENWPATQPDYNDWWLELPRRFQPTP